MSVPQELREVEDAVKDGVTTVILFTAPWCKPCEEAYHALSEITDMSAEVKVYVIDLSKYPEAAIKYSVINVPTLIVFKGGKPITRKVGVVRGEELRSLISPGSGK